MHEADLCKGLSEEAPSPLAPDLMKGKALGGEEGEEDDASA